VHSYLLPVAESLIDGQQYNEAIEMCQLGGKLLDDGRMRLTPAYRLELTDALAKAYIGLHQMEQARLCYQRTIAYLRNTPAGANYLEAAQRSYRELNKKGE
jgi:hypothetical protein